MTGTIKSFNADKGFGFITASKSYGGGDYFFHYTALKNCKMRELSDGDEVEFEEVDHPKGPRAEDVFLVSA